MAKIIHNNSFMLMGTNYHQKEALAIAEKLAKGQFYLNKTNSEIKDYIQSHSRALYKFYDLKTTDVKLVKEPQNKYDKYAIKVIVKGIFAGYIPADIARDIHSYIGNINYNYIAEIEGRGGPYKTLSADFKKVIDGKKDISFYLTLRIIQAPNKQLSQLYNMSLPQFFLSLMTVILVVLNLLFGAVAFSFLIQGKLLEFIVGLSISLLMTLAIYFLLKKKSK